MPTKHHSRADWIDAAIEAFRDGGVQAVAVEPLARRLGVSKGSFYWHFDDRAELVKAALHHWAVDRTHEMIARLEEIDDPAGRLRALIGAGFSQGAFSIDPIDIALLTSLSDPAVAEPLSAHHEAWIQFSQKIWNDLGVPDPKAKALGILGYSSYVGLVVLAATNPSSLSTISDLGPTELVDYLLAWQPPGS